MDPELRRWLERQEAATVGIAIDQKRQADVLTIMVRELANLTELLTPKTGDGESALEQLLAQLAAQGKEQLALLRQLGQLTSRIERRMSRPDASPPLPVNGQVRPP